MGVQNRQLKPENWTIFPANVSSPYHLHQSTPPSLVLTVSFFCIVEMESAKQRVRAVVARQKEEKRANEAGGETSSTPKAITKQAKRKPDGSDGRPAKKAAVTPGDGAAKEKSPLKPSHGASKGVMTSLGPINEGPYCLLTHKDYAVGEVKSFIKPTDIEPYDLLGTEDLKASALFDLTRVCLLPFGPTDLILL